jgi:hypothetical protein
MADNDTACAAADSSHGSASIELPPFWQANPANWFRAADAQFAIRNVTQPIDKYYLVLAALNEQQFELISHVMDDEPSATSYNNLKEALLANNTITPYQLVDRLVNMEPLGGRKTSELLVAMQKYRPPKDEHFFVYHFLQRLPREIRVLLAHEDQSDMRKLAEKADALRALHQLQVHDVTVAAVAAGPPPATTEEDGAVVAVAAASRPKKGSQSGKKRSGKPRRSSHSPVDFQQSSLCYFHVRYGDKAHRCEEPCAWPGN